MAHAVNLNELGHALVIRDPYPPFRLPMLLGGIPHRPVNSDLPSPIGQDIQPKLSHAGLLEERNRTARSGINLLSHSGNGRPEVFDLSEIQFEHLGQTREIEGLIVGLDALVHGPVGDDHTIGPRHLLTGLLNVIYSPLRDKQPLRRKDMLHL